MKEYFVAASKCKRLQTAPMNKIRNIGSDKRSSRQSGG
jgi:hypothetical protein